ncbi:MAG: DUF1080 domain-containing protein [Planctomycetaceae bacterium]|nr:DUF1080 domain-containing protein [Planctomycetaceae bacterium]
MKQVLPVLMLLGFASSAASQEPAKIPNPADVKDSTETQPATSKTDEPNVPPEAVDLLSGDFEKQWKVFAAEPSPSVWKIVREPAEAEPVLVCTGEIKGFLATVEPYDDFELKFEWKYPKDANGNSGILVYTQDEERIWPTSVQIQLHQPKAGSIFPSGDAMTDNTRDVDLNLAHPVNMWNEGRIISRKGRLTVEINGKKAGEVTGARPSAGRIALQSEGSEVHFRNLKVRKLPPEPAPAAAPEAPAATPPKPDAAPK